LLDVWIYTHIYIHTYTHIYMYAYTPTVFWRTIAKLRL